MVADAIRTPLTRCVKSLLCLLQGWFCPTPRGVTAWLLRALPLAGDAQPSALP